MSHPDCAFAFAQARMQARLGARATAGDWQRLLAARDLNALLQVAASTSLAPWTHGLGSHAGVHALEQRLRGHWLATVDEIAAWQPARWRAAIRWMRWLPYLPAIEKLARAGRTPGWMRTDPVLAPIVATEFRARAAAVRHADFAPLARVFGSQPDVAAAWLAQWRTLWPPGADGPAPIARLAHEVAAVRRELAAPAGLVATDTVLRRLERRLVTLFRRNPLAPVATVAFLGLAALDLSRLRGAVAALALATPGAEAA